MTEHVGIDRSDRTAESDKLSRRRFMAGLSTWSRAAIGLLALATLQALARTFINLRDYRVDLPLPAKIVQGNSDKNNITVHGVTQASIDKRYPAPSHNATQEEQSSISTSPSFLVFYSHSGYSNQLMGLQRAAQFAYATNRILVLPPVLPHGKNDAQRYRQWRPGSAVSGCRAYQSVPQHQAGVLKHASIASKLSDWSEFPSFHSIMDFDVLTRHTGLQVVDLDEFMKQQRKPDTMNMTREHFPDWYFQAYNTSTRSWCDGNIPRKTFKVEDLEKGCEVEPPLPYNALTEEFYHKLSAQHASNNFSKGEEYNKDCRVANIGSGFLLRNEFDDPTKKIFDEFFGNYPLVSPWNEILRMIMASIPDQSFMGVHVRTQDVEDGCPYLLYRGVAEELVNKLEASGKKNNDTKSNNQPSLVVIGRVNMNSKTCMVDALRKEMGARNSSIPMPAVKTVSDLIDTHPQHEQLNKLTSTIALETSTVNLLLDQFILAMARDLIMKCAYSGSTFQVLISNRNAYRDENMLQLGFKLAN
jgi:hypothetical protein